jgi:hypothetical protein
MTDPTLAEQPEIVSLRLTADQLRVLGPIFERQRAEKVGPPYAEKVGAILSVVTNTYDPLEGCAVATLQVAWLPWSSAQKVCRLIRNCITNGRAHSILPGVEPSDSEHK